MRKVVFSILIAGFLLAAGAWMAARAASEATITVTTTQDTILNDGLCSLREAVIAANTNAAYNGCPAGGATDIIDLDPGLGSPATFLLTRTGAAEDAAQTGDLDIFGTVTINGFGAGSTILDGNQSDRVLDIRPAARVYVNGVTLRYGNPGAAEGGGAYVAGTGRLYLQASDVISNTATAGAGVKSFGLLDAGQVKISANQGGGIKNDGGLLILDNTHVVNNSGGFGILNQNSAQMTFNTGTVSGNTSGGIRNADGSDATLSNLTISFNTGGGGIHNKGTATTHLTLSSSTIANNSGISGAGILNEGIGTVASITNTTIRNNTATAGGGGINNSGNLDITRSVLDHNQARSGGGIDHIGSNLTLANVTISQNSVSDNGGGLYNRSTAFLNFVTMVSNSAGAPGTGGNLYNDGDSTSISLHNTIIADGGTAENCTNNLGQINSLGYNLEDTDTCYFDAAGDKPNSNPQLGPLQDNGGLTHTHALLVGSQAIDSGHSTGCSGTTDQRGISRPQGATCDIGAYELIFGSTDIFLSNNTADENQPINTVVGVLSATSPDPAATFTFSLACTVAGADDGSFNINGTNLRTSAIFNYETKSAYNICIRATDQGGLTFDKNFVVNVNNLNEAPTNSSLSNNTVNENQPINTVVGALTASDPDAGATFTFNLACTVAGADDGSFNILGTNLRTSAVFDFETNTAYNICIRVTDQGGLTFDKNYVVNVNNLNEAPTNSSLSNNAVNENQSIDTVVGALSASDPDAGATFTFSQTCTVAGADDGSFNILGTNLRTSAIFDFETKTAYNICIRVTDQGGLTFDKNFVVNVNNVNEAPTNSSLSNNAVNENQPVNTVVGALSATDPDAGATFTFSLTCAVAGADDGSFNVSGTNLRTSAIFDFETKPAYNICIRVTDQGGLTFDKNYIVNVNDINETQKYLYLPVIR